MVKKKTAKKGTKTAKKKTVSSSKKKGSKKRPSKKSSKSTKKNTQKPKVKKTEIRPSVKKGTQVEENKRYNVVSIVVAVVIVAIIALVMFFNANNSSESVGEDVVAIMGDEEITMQELDEQYNSLNDNYKNFVSKASFLENVMIPQKVLLIESESISDERVDTVYQQRIDEMNLTGEQAEELLAQQGSSKEQFKEVIKTYLYLNDTLYQDIEVTDEEIEDFYENNKASMIGENNETLPLDEVRDQIEQSLFDQKAQQVAEAHISQLMEDMEIEIFYESEGNQTENIVVNASAAAE